MNINESILQQKWPRNNFDPKAPQHVQKIEWQKNDEKETTPMITTFLENIMTNSNDEKETTPWGTPRSKMGSNGVNTTTMEINFV